MSKVQMLRYLVNQRLSVAVEEIFDLFERTIAEYEEQLHRSNEENHRQQKLLDAVFNPEVQLQRADIQQLMGSKKEFLPEQQEVVVHLRHEDPPEPANIKEELEELWSSQETEQLQGEEEADLSMLTFTPVPVKREDENAEKAQSSQLDENQNRDMGYLKTESYQEDRGVSDADRDFNPDTHLQPVTPEQSSDLSRSETDDSGEWEESDEPLQGLETQQNKDDTDISVQCNSVNASVSFSECAPNSRQKKHTEKEKVKKPYHCLVCGKRYCREKYLKVHMISHIEKEYFHCSVCDRSFPLREELMAHMRIHTAEKLFSCSLCSSTFTSQSSLVKHLKAHTGEKPFACSICNGAFRHKRELDLHMRMHTGEKPFSCTVCGRRFARNRHLKIHSTVHTGEKAYSCPICGKRFSQSGNRRRHMIVHTGEKPFSCSICKQVFTQRDSVRRHILVCHKSPTSPCQEK
ncbi:zinc finger and BTB domain-containing protein 49-like [Cheilinus undulatus]|uniref:zinc finger and BTB domain-containing protein 49-like n=1 Tax=Cheilinus undulatus TaxID=241271 RepID=UPI001BD4E41E|nr:zinc finger and BTB domain-containing protein 49-like [Cheilinus undulatus]